MNLGHKVLWNEWLIPSRHNEWGVDAGQNDRLSSCCCQVHRITSVKYYLQRRKDFIWCRNAF